MEYTMTINTVSSGWVKTNGGKSLTGHMWITLTDEYGNQYSYGFDPENGPAIAGPGIVTGDDPSIYGGAEYSYTAKITYGQFQAMKTYGDTAKNDPEHSTFDFNYVVGGNNCIAFVYSMMNVGAQAVGINLENFTSNDFNIFFLTGMPPSWMMGNAELLANAMAINPTGPTTQYFSVQTTTSDDYITPQTPVVEGISIIDNILFNDPTVLIQAYQAYMGDVNSVKR